MKNLQEELKRIKSLMTEERLYGNLVNDSKKPLLTESWRSKMIAVLRKASKTDLDLLNKGYIDELSSAVMKTGDNRYNAIKNIFDKINSGAFNANSEMFFKNLGVKGDELEYFISQYRKIQLLLTKSLADKYDINMMVKYYKTFSLTSNNIQDMIDLIYPYNDNIRSLFGRARMVIDRTKKVILTKAMATAKSIQIRKNILEKLESWDLKRLQKAAQTDGVIKQKADGTMVSTGGSPKIKTTSGGAVVTQDEHRWLLTKAMLFIFVRMKFPYITRILEKQPFFTTQPGKGLRWILSHAPFIIPLCFGISASVKEFFNPTGGYAATARELFKGVVGYLKHIPLIFLIKEVTIYGVKKLYDDVPENIYNKIGGIVKGMMEKGTFVCDFEIESCEVCMIRNKAKIIESAAQDARDDNAVLDSLTGWIRNRLPEDLSKDMSIQELVAKGTEAYFTDARLKEACDDGLLTASGIEFYTKDEIIEGAEEAIEEAEEEINKQIEVTEGDFCDILTTLDDWKESLRGELPSDVCNFDEWSVNHMKQQICKCNSKTASNNTRGIDLCNKAFDELFKEKCNGE